MAATTVNLFIDSGLLQECQQEHQQVTDTQPYHCPIPKNVTPSPLK
ncbi:amidohydrolase, partial [Escherichia coli]|jgi:aminobenzoyl-glutamate utilization protein B|nr:amidohydrolase [Escherichia coli]